VVDFRTKYLPGYFVIAEAQGRYEVVGFYAKDITRAQTISNAFTEAGRACRIILAGTLHHPVNPRPPPMLKVGAAGVHELVDDDSDEPADPVRFIAGLQTPWGDEPEEGTGRTMGA
jgi:hypothetical protein